MFRYPGKEFRTNPPASVEYQGYNRKFTDLTRQQWDEIGYNEAAPLKREPFTTYETQWVKGDDLIYREEVVSAVVDGAAKDAHEAATIRAERDRRLAETDWTQLVDSALSDESMVLWQSYRQALRDVPQQDGFPASVAWPDPLAAE